MKEQQFKQFENNILTNAPVSSSNLTSAQINNLENKIYDNCIDPNADDTKLQYKGGPNAVHALAHRLWEAGITDGIENDVGSWNHETIQTVISDLNEIYTEKQDNENEHLIKQISKILDNDNIQQSELSWDNQHGEIDDDSDLSNYPAEELRVFLNRAETLDYFYHDKSVWNLIHVNSVKQCHDTIVSNVPKPTDSNLVSHNIVDKLFKIMKCYHTNTVQISIESGDWADNDDGNDGYVVASTPYLLRFYENAQDLQHAVKSIPTYYVTASAEHFFKPVFGDIRNELQELANYLTDHANSEKLNDKYYPYTVEKMNKAEEL